MLKLRAATAVVLLAVVAAALFLAPASLWTLFCAAVLVACAWEWGRIAGLSPIATSLYCGLLLLALAFVYVGPPVLLDGAFGIGCLFWWLVVPWWLHQRPRPSRLVLLGCGLLVLVSAVSALQFLRRLEASLLLAVMAVAWVSDTVAYLAGRRFGRRKLAPAISPGKTWEGLAAGLFAASVYALVIGLEAPHLWLRPVTAIQWIMAGLVLAVLGVMGDLFESQLKRVAGVKDSGKLLPGHGGVLDRVDALLPMLPAVAWLALRFGE